jgi:hypothetical protein
MKISIERLSLIVYIGIIIFASCQIPEIDDKINVENSVVTEIIEDKENYIMEIKPIDDYAAYAFTDQGSLFGLEDSKKVYITILDTEDNTCKLNDFFKVGEIIYFNIKGTEQGAVIPDTDPVQYESVEKIYYFLQDKGVVLDIDVSEYPDKPESDFVTMADGIFQIMEYINKDVVHSRVLRNGAPTAFKMIDGYFYTPAGLWFSVPETLSVRLRGIYFYNHKDNLTQFPDIAGRIW